MKQALYLDADDTIWDVYPSGIASNCRPPYKRIGKDIIMGTTKRATRRGKYETDSCFIMLKDGARELIEWTKENDMDVVLVSANDPEPVIEATNELGLDFDREYVDWFFGKSKVEIVQEDMKKYGIDDAAFIDDLAIFEVQDYCEKHKDECKIDPTTGLYELKSDDLRVYDNIYEYIKKELKGAVKII